MILKQLKKKFKNDTQIIYKQPILPKFIFTNSYEGIIYILKALLNGNLFNVKSKIRLA